MPERKSITGMIRPDLVDFVGYAASKSPDTLVGKDAFTPEQIVKLDANENSFGCSPEVMRALAGFKDYNIYPDATQSELRKALAGYTGVSAERIVAASGSDQLIDNLCRLFVSPGDEVINCVPTFAMFRFFIQLCGGKAVEVLRDADFHVDVAAVKRAITPRTKLIFIATPDNPTGVVTPRADILEILDTGLPVLIDEAYYEFTGETVTDLLDEYPNLMMLRTFSKWAGLAGLRIGYGMFPLEIAAYLMAIKEPYCVNAAAQVAVYASLKDVAALKEKVKLIVAERERLFAFLQEIDWLQPYPSAANFVLCKALKGKAADIQQKLEQRGVLTRYFDTPLLANCIRFSVGRPDQNEILIRELEIIGGDGNA
jgi:histidinol-phosphate aminotransferase